MAINREPANGLKSNMIGLVGAATLGVVMLSPAMTLYGNFGPAFIPAGRTVPLAFFFALIATLPTALSYALLAREYPNSGSAANWVSRWSVGPFARWAGWIIFMYYLFNFVIQPITLGVFASDLFKLLTLPSGLPIYFAGVLFCCAFAAWIVYRGVHLSVEGAFGFLAFETLVVAALCITVAVAIAKTPSGLSLEGLRISSSPEGFSGIFRAMVFGMLAFCGFDVISTLGEEAKSPRRLIPQATFLAVFIFGVFIILGVWILSFALPADRIHAVVDSGGMPISEIAHNFWGRGSVMVPLTAISAALGIAVATAMGASRILFAMGRQNLAPRHFAELNAKYQVPYKAMHLVFAVGFLASILTAIFLGPYFSYVWWCTTSTFFAMITFILVNASCLVLFWSRARQSAANFVLYALIPILAIGADLFILIQSFFIELWRQGWRDGQSVIVFDLLCAILAVIFAWRRKTTAYAETTASANIKAPAI